LEEVTAMQKFWATARMVVMNRQPGMTWADTGGMSIVDFLHVLSVSEKFESERKKANQRKK